jgi:acyl carrier protein
MEELIEKLKMDIIKALNLEEVSPDDIDAEAPLFLEGLGLDSIDALELIVLLEKKYNFKIPTADEGKQVLYSVKTMAEAISANQKA